MFVRNKQSIPQYLKEKKKNKSTKVEFKASKLTRRKKERKKEVSKKM